MLKATKIKPVHPFFLSSSESTKILVKFRRSREHSSFVFEKKRERGSLAFIFKTPREIGSEFVYYETHYVGVLVISGGIGSATGLKIA